MIFEEWYAKNSDEILKIKNFSAEFIVEDLNLLDMMLDKSRVYIARSGELLSEADYYYRQELAEAINRQVQTNNVEAVGKSNIKAMAEGEVAYIHKVYKGLERLNRALTHGMEALRTRISLQKQLQYSYQQGSQGTGAQ